MTKWDLTPLIGLLLCSSVALAQEETTVQTGEGFEGFESRLVAEFYGILNEDDPLDLQGYGYEGLYKYGFAIDNADRGYYDFGTYADRKGLNELADKFVGVRWYGFVRVPMSGAYIIQVKHYHQNSTCATYVDFNNTRIYSLPEGQVNTPTGEKPSRERRGAMTLDQDSLYPIEIRLNCVSYLEGKPVSPMRTVHHRLNGYEINLVHQESGKVIRISNDNTYHIVD